MKTHQSNRRRRAPKDGASGRRDSPACTPETGARIEGIGVQPLPDGRRLDVAVDLTPWSASECEQNNPGLPRGPRLELAVESPAGRHVCSTTLIACRRRTVDLVMHLRGHIEPGEYRLHVGLFWNEVLLHHEQRTFLLPLAVSQR